MSEKKALFIGAHNDDCEYGGGGLAYILSQKGYKVIFLNVACKRRIYAKTPEEVKRYEVYKDANICKAYEEQEYKAASILGAEKIVIGKRDNSFYECTNENIYAIKDIAEGINPDITFIHWPKDNHPDHVEVSRASFRALCYSSECEIHAFEAGPNQTMLHFHPDFFINIEHCMDKLKECSMEFNQPSASGGSIYADKEAGAVYRGYLSDFKYAEAYKILRFPSEYNELMLPKLLKQDFKWMGNGQYAWGSQYFL